MKKFIIPILALLFISLASAEIAVTFPENNLISLNPYTTSYSFEFENQNSSETPIVSLSLSPSLDNIVTISDSSISVPVKNSATINLESSATPGTYEGSIIWSDDGSPSTNGEIQVSVFIPDEENTSTGDYDVIVFPTSKIVTVKQGNEKTQNVMITVPENYPRTITIQSVDFNPGTEAILFGDLNLGQVAPGQSISIPITFSGVDAQTGSYQTNLNIFATDSEGQVNLPSVSLTLQVTAGVTPIDSTTFSTPPTCSLSANTLNLNNTYSFTCSGVVSNLQIDIPSSEFYIGKNVEASSNLYRYDFIPVKYGNTEFKADFKYHGASIFEPFRQDIRISSAGSVVPGTTLKFLFTPILTESSDDGARLIQLVDNRTGSLVTNPKIWIDAVAVNSSSDTFEFSFEEGKEYELRGKADGYEDLVQTINVTPSDIDIFVTPEIGSSMTTFTINTSVENSTIIIGEQEYLNKFVGRLPSGTNIIKAKAEGYKTKEINFSVTPSIQVLQNNEFKKGKLANFTLSEPTEWIVYYRKHITDLERTEMASGNDSVVSFTPDKVGFYSIENSDGQISSYEIEAFALNKKYAGLYVWAWILILGGVAIGGYFVLNRVNNKKVSGGVSEFELTPA